MGTHLRFTPVLALVGALALGAAPAARAQDTSSAKADTSGVQGYGAADTSGVQGYGAGQAGADTGAKYNGPPTDTTLKAKPGVQTGPSAADSSKVGQSGQNSASVADTVACKDGSNAPRSGEPCLRHGGIDWAATEAAAKARGETVPMGDSASADTALRAKPGVQTGPTDSSAARQADSTKNQ